MAKRAEPNETIDVVRSRLAEAVSAPVPPVRVTPSVQKKMPPRSSTGNGRAKVSRKRAGEARVKSDRPDALTINRKFMVSEHDAEMIDEMTAIISAAFGSKVPHSAVSRALWAVVANAEEAIIAGGRGHNRQKLRVPSKGNHLAMVEYEEALASFLTLALKRR